MTPFYVALLIGMSLGFLVTMCVLGMWLLWLDWRAERRWKRVWTTQTMQRSHLYDIRS